MASEGEVRALLGQPNFRRYLFSLAASDIGNRMTYVALAFAVLDIQHTPSAVGLVLGAGAIAFLVGLGTGGVLGDRFDRRRVMVLCDAARFVTQGAAAALVFSGDARLWNLALLAAATEFGTGIFLPSSQGLVQSVVDEPYYAAAAGLRAIAVSLGESIGPLIGGVVVAAASPAWGLAADAATFVVSGLALSGIRSEVSLSPPKTDQSMLRQLAEGWSEFRARRWLWASIASAAVTQFVWGAWSVLGPVVASNRLGGAAAWGAILTAMGVGALVGAAIATRARPRRPLVLFACCYASFAIPLMCLAAGAPALVVGVAAFFTGVCILLGESVWEVAFLRSIPEHLIARMSAYDWAGSSALVPIGLAVWGPLAVAFGTNAALWIGAGVTLAAIGALLLVPEVRHFDGDRAPAPRTTK